MFAFELIRLDHKKKKYIICCNSLQQKKKWMADLRKYMQLCLKNENEKMKRQSALIDPTMDLEAQLGQRYVTMLSSTFFFFQTFFFHFKLTLVFIF
jgi:hypothetical protein